ncbi:MAG: NAD(P)H-hydrate dehydratase [Elusimicrobia bacterium]|nr:NAD(P)H-hydrate dehydratase [Elusimicrobiota bacterium]
MKRTGKAGNNGLVHREPADHKGVFGHILVIAGSSGMAGAAILACRAALRSGAGLVTLAVPSSLQGIVAAAAPEAMTLGLSESGGCLRSDGVARLLEAAVNKDFTALAIGPGLSTHPETAKFVVNVLNALSLPAVVDADALNNLALQDTAQVGQMLRRRSGRMVFTPHPGEMARCLQSSVPDILRDREGAAKKLAREWGGVVVLKGRGSVITDGSAVVVNPFGGPGLAKGGSGDLLTGLIGGLWVQMIASGRVSGDLAFQAAALGCRIHGLAGDLAEKDLTAWAMTPTDVLARFPDAFKAARRRKAGGRAGTEGGAGWRSPGPPR